MNPILLIDGYKLDHRRQYPPKTEFIQSNWTPRSSRVPGQKEVVFFGLQYFLQKYLIEQFDHFFNEDRGIVKEEYLRRINGYLGPNSIGNDHIGALWDLGYVPLRFKALPEGTKVPLRVPMFTVENTLPKFFWLVNYIETLLSNVLWLPCTSATTALRIRKMLDTFAAGTGGAKDFVDWQGHDFSFRGMAGPEAAALSGAGHLLSFTGTDTIPAIELLEDYYAGTDLLVGGSVPATEHSVMSAGGDKGEQETFDRLLDLYPTGIVSVVSDTWDLWNVIDYILPNLKNKILAREGKLVIRPDSGDPVKIIPEALKRLLRIFGGTTNEKGFKVLDPHIGLIYGDGINEETMARILAHMTDEGFASTNVVFGVGSYTYQHVTRDTYGFAMKATWAQIDGESHDIYKKPVTDDGTKHSAKGRVSVVEKDGILTLLEGDSDKNLLETVWEDGVFEKTINLKTIRENIRK